MFNTDAFVGWVAIIKWKQFNNPDYEEGVTCRNGNCTNEEVYPTGEANFCITCGSRLQDAGDLEPPILSPEEFLEMYHGEKYDHLTSFDVVKINAINMTEDPNRPNNIRNKYDGLEVTIVGQIADETCVQHIEEDVIDDMAFLPTRAPSKAEAKAVYEADLEPLMEFIETYDVVYGIVDME